MRVLVSRRAAIAVVAVAAAVLAGSAAGRWSASGGGTGSSPVGSAAAVTLSAGSPAGALFPGQSADVAVSIANPNAHRVFVGSLALDTAQGTGGFAVDAGHAGCGLAALTYTTQTNGGAGWFVAAGSSLDVQLANAVALGAGAASACQGATFTVYLQAGP
jgi:hypothetical protein